MTTQLLTVQANWVSPVLERLEWKTDVLKSRDGSEQRIKLREHPRHILEYDFLIYKDDLRHFQTQLLRWQGAQWVIPLWMHFQPLPSSVNVGTTRIPLTATDTYEYQVGSFIALFGGYSACEYREVSAVGSNYVDVTQGLSKAWPAGTWAMPARSGRLRETVNMSAITGDVVSGNLQAILDNTRGFQYQITDTLDGHLILLNEPNRVAPLAINWERNMGILDYGTGPITAYDLHGYTEVVRTFDYAHYSRQQAGKVRSLINHCKGMHKPFLAPTFQADMVPAIDHLASDTYLTIKNINYTNDFFYRVTYPYIRIELNFGVPVFRKVIGSVDLLNGTERLQLDQAVGSTFKTTDVKRISLVNMSRLDSDSVEFNWVTPNFCTSQIPVRSIPE